MCIQYMHVLIILFQYDTLIYIIIFIILDFEDAMPSLGDFSTLLLHCDYTKWREIANCLEVNLSMNSLSGSLEDDELLDQKSFLVTLAYWREKVSIKQPGRKANWRNFREALTKFDDIVKGIDKIKQE